MRDRCGTRIVLAHVAMCTCLFLHVPRLACLFTEATCVRDLHAAVRLTHWHHQPPAVPTGTRCCTEVKTRGEPWADAARFRALSLYHLTRSSSSASTAVSAAQPLTTTFNASDARGPSQGSSMPPVPRSQAGPCSQAGVPCSSQATGLPHPQSEQPHAARPGSCDAGACVPRKVALLGFGLPGVGKVGGKQGAAAGHRSTTTTDPLLPAGACTCCWERVHAWYTESQPDELCCSFVVYAGQWHVLALIACLGGHGVCVCVQSTILRALAGAVANALYLDKDDVNAALLRGSDGTTQQHEYFSEHYNQYVRVQVRYSQVSLCCMCSSSCCHDEPCASGHA